LSEAICSQVMANYVAITGSLKISQKISQKIKF